MAVSRRSSTQRQEDVEARIRAAIVALRPLIHLDEVGLELVEFEARSGCAVLRIAGDCPDCSMSTVTLMQGIEANLRMAVPEIRQVRAISPS
jgi:Fe-S cluster biogenesis protein NfuA